MARLQKQQIAALVRDAQSGDKGAFSRLYIATIHAQYFTAFSILGDRALAEDAVQAAYLRAYRKIKNLQKPENFLSWMSTITYNYCLSLMKREGKIITNLDEEIFLKMPDTSRLIDPVENAVSKENQSLIMQVFQSLSPDHRSVLLLRYYQNLKVSEIAEIIDCTEGTVKSRIHYGLKQMKKELVSRGYYGTESLLGMGFTLTKSLQLAGGPCAVLPEAGNSFSQTLKTAAVLGVTGCFLFGLNTVLNPPASTKGGVSRPADHEPPVLKSYTREKHLLTLSFEDAGTGIDYESAKITDVYGKPVKIKNVVEQSGEIKIPYYEKNSLTISLSDLAGNEQTFHIEPLNKAYAQK